MHILGQELTRRQIAFIVLATVILLMIFALIIFIYTRKKMIKKNFKKYYYKKIYGIAMDKDYYLLNNFSFKTDSEHFGIVDHLLFGEKYIYVISDYHYDGDLSGKEEDSDLWFHDRKGQKLWSSNPLNASKELVSELSITLDYDPDFFIGIILVNDDCTIGVEFRSKQFYIVNRKQIANLIKKIESREVEKLNPDQLATVVHALKDMNLSKKK